jgi:hypothetical protein
LDWNILVEQESERAASEYAAGEIPHDRLSLYMEVAKHFVTMPPAKQTDNITVDMGA